MSIRVVSEVSRAARDVSLRRELRVRWVNVDAKGWVLLRLGRAGLRCGYL